MCLEAQSPGTNAPTAAFKDSDAGIQRTNCWLNKHTSAYQRLHSEVTCHISWNNCRFAQYIFRFRLLILHVCYSYFRTQICFNTLFRLHVAVTLWLHCIIMQLKNISSLNVWSFVVCPMSGKPTVRHLTTYVRNHVVEKANVHNDSERNTAVTSSARVTPAVAVTVQTWALLLWFGG